MLGTLFHKTFPRPFKTIRVVAAHVPPAHLRKVSKQYLSATPIIRRTSFESDLTTRGLALCPWKHQYCSSTKVYPQSRYTEAKGNLVSVTFIWNVNTLIYRERKVKQVHISFLITRYFLTIPIDEGLSGPSSNIDLGQGLPNFFHNRNLLVLKNLTRLRKKTQRELCKIQQKGICDVVTTKEVMLRNLFMSEYSWQ